MIRPELLALTRRWSEVLTGLGVAAIGIWGLQARGSFYQVLAALILATGVALALIGWRRLRFQRAGQAPGVVQVVEAQISYFGPETGGFIGGADLVEVHLLANGPTWRLMDQDGTVLDIPVAAEGTGALYDVFASLPGIDMPQLLRVLEEGLTQDRVVWLHPARRKRRPALV